MNGCMSQDVFSSEERQKLLSEISVLKTENVRLLRLTHDTVYKDFFDACPDIIFKLNLNAEINFAHVPHRPEEYIASISGKKIFDVAPKEFHEKLRSGIVKIIQTGESFVYESEGRFLGKYKYYENFLSPMKNQMGNVIAIFFYSKDISKQKIIEQSLIKNQNTLKTIFENSEHFITVIDLDRKFIWFNKKSEALSPVIFGKKLELDCEAETFIPEENRANFVHSFNRALNGECINYIRQYTVNNTPYHLEIFINPVYEGGEITSVSLIGVDISRHKEHEDYLKQMNVELTQQNEQLNEFSYIISHNLRGPIANIMGLLDLFKYHKNDPDQLEQFLFHITKAVRKLDEIILDLNAVVTNQDNDVSNYSTVNLEEECMSINGLLSVQIKNVSAEFKYDFAACPDIHSIKSYIHNILYNLISNAIKYRRYDCAPVISLSSSKTSGMICITCTDNGIGMDLEKYQDKLFGFYKRFHSHVEGKGLGLHLIKKQVDALGGRIEVDSVVGKGTTFVILLPA
jgi:PAS domain S-box-containing protein